MPDLRAYARDAATRNGIDPDNFERQIQQESGFNPDAHNDASGADGIAQIVVRWHPTMAGKTGDPYASLDYAAGLMRNHLAVYGGDWALGLSCYNAGPAATANGLAGNLDGWPYAETVRYVSRILRISEADARARLTGAAPMPKLTYNPDAPVDIQDNDWSCSEQSAQWLLRAIGRNPGDAWIRGQLLNQGLVTQQYGLMDASGTMLAAWLQREYGDEMGLTFTAKNGATWDDVAALAGKQPLMLGGRAWNHWTGVRRLQNDGLELANPAPQWKDVGTLLDRAEFDRWGGWSYITVSDGASVLTPQPEPADNKDAIIAQLRAEVTSLRNDLADKNSKLGAVAVDYAGQLRTLSERLAELKPT